MAAVNMKLQPFWANDPQVWFAHRYNTQVHYIYMVRPGGRSVCHARNHRDTVQKTKFDYIVASLAPEFATEIQDLVLSPPAKCPYDKLKEQLESLSLSRSGTTAPQC